MTLSVNSGFPEHGTTHAAGGSAAPEFTVMALDADKVEGNAGPTAFTFTITRSGDLAGEVTLDYAVTGNGVDAMDFVGASLPSGAVTFADGVGGERTVTVEVNGDLDPESDETFTLVLSDPATQTSQASGTIPATGQDVSLSLTTLDRSNATALDVSGTIALGDTAGASQFNIVYVVDVSGSTRNAFVGTTLVGDQNGDGRSDTILDAEIAGYKALTQSLIDAGLGGSAVALVPFGSGATTTFMGTIGQDEDGNGIPDIVDGLEGLGTTGATNFERPLQEAIDFLNDQTDGENFVFFLSDGRQNSGGAFSDEAVILTDPDGLDATIRAIGVGTGAAIDQLDLVDDGLDNDSVEPAVLDPESLEAGLVGSDIDPAAIDRLELSVNGVLSATLAPDALSVTPFGLTYQATLTGLDVNADDMVTARVFFTGDDGAVFETTQTVESLSGAMGTIRNDDMADDGAGDPGNGSDPGDPGDPSDGGDGGDAGDAGDGGDAGDMGEGGHAGDRVGDPCGLVVQHVNDWFNPAWGGGYVARFELTITEDLLMGDTTTGWSLDLDLAEGNFVNGWLDGFTGPVDFDVATGTFSTVGSSWQPELRAGDTLNIGIQVSGAGFDAEDVTCLFTDEDIITDDVDPRGLAVTAEPVNDWGFGAVQQVSIENTGPADVNQWIVRLDLDPGDLDGIALGTVWGADHADDGEDLLFFPADYTRPVEAGGIETFGFEAAFSDGSGASWEAGDFQVIGIDDVPADIINTMDEFFF